MGDSTSSMLVFFLIVIVLYIAGAAIYTIYEKVRGKRRNKKYE